MSTVDAITKFTAEIIATALLLFAGCSGTLTWGKELPGFFSALAFGLSVMILIQCFGPISGAHMNPAVTVAALIFKLISWPVSVGSLCSKPSTCWNSIAFFVSDDDFLLCRSNDWCRCWLWLTEKSYTGPCVQRKCWQFWLLHNSSEWKRNTVPSVFYRVHRNHDSNHHLLFSMGSTEC